MGFVNLALFSSIITPGYLAKSFTLLVTTVTFSDMESTCDLKIIDPSALDTTPMPAGESLTLRSPRQLAQLLVND